MEALIASLHLSEHKEDLTQEIAIMPPATKCNEESVVNFLHSPKNELSNLNKDMPSRIDMMGDYVL